MTGSGRAGEGDDVGRGWLQAFRNSRQYALLKSAVRLLQDNRAAVDRGGDPETAERLKEINRSQNDSCPIVKMILNFMFVTIGVVLLLGVVVVIIYTSVVKLGTSQDFFQLKSFVDSLHQPASPLSPDEAHHQHEDAAGAVSTGEEHGNFDYANQPQSRSPSASANNHVDRATRPRSAAVRDDDDLSSSVDFPSSLSSSSSSSSSFAHLSPAGGNVSANAGQEINPLPVMSFDKSQTSKLLTSGAAEVGILVTPGATVSKRLVPHVKERGFTKPTQQQQQQQPTAVRCRYVPVVYGGQSVVQLGKLCHESTASEKAGGSQTVDITDKA